MCHALLKEWRYRISKVPLEIVRFMDALFRDISHLLSAVDEGMQTLFLTSLWGSPCYFNASKALGGYPAWMPHVFTRNYVPKKAGKDFTRFAFFNIYLSPKYFNEPVAVWGTAERRDMTDIFPVWSAGILNSTGPTFLRMASVDRLTATSDVPELFHSFEFAAKPLLSMNNAEIVSALVVKPFEAYPDLVLPDIEELN
jgi:hypothetical protein